MKHKILSLYVFAAGMLLGGCAIESPEAPRGNKVTVTASMRNDDTKVALYQDDTSLSLFAAWEYEDDYVVPILNNGMYKKAQRTEVYNISNDRMTASFNYELEDDYFIPDAGYQFLCFTENCNAMIIDDEVYYNASLEREILSRYRAPMFAERNNVKSKSNIGVNFGHYLTYEILHLKNTSSEQITFSLNGFNSPDGIWYKTQGAICHRTGKFLTESEAAKAPITKSPTYYFPAGYDDAFISAYIPIEGMKISNATLVAEINGETVTSSNTKSSNVELKTGHAYHMYVEWDGKELKFVDGFNDTLPNPDAEYVDLGLSVMWATCNLGAAKPEEYGLYYQWGDTQGYGSDTSDGKYFDWDNYKWTDSLTKYNTLPWDGMVVDNKTVLEMEDDAARAALGGKWRMPTDAEWTELGENCTWTWTDNYNGTGVSGRVVTSNKIGYTDKSIFLPAAGCRDSDDLENVGSSGYYWSSSLRTDDPFNAYGVGFHSGGVYRRSSQRFYGRSVRPVYTETEATPSISVTPTDLDFGTVTVGSSAQKTFTVTNTGSATTDVVISTPSEPFTADFSGNISLNPGASKTVTVTFTPKDGNQYRDSMTIRANASNGTSKTVALSGGGDEQAKAMITIDEEKLNFGVVTVGENKTLTFKVTNTGSAPLQITKIGVTATDCLSVSPTSMTVDANGGSKTVSVTYQPTSEGYVEDVVFIKSNAANYDTKYVLISGEAKETVDNTLSVSTTSIDFADTRIGQTVKKSFTVTNNGSSTLTTRLIFHKAVTVPDLDWEDSGSYISLAPKESKTITLIYLPKGKISGNWELIFETVDMYVESPIVKVTGNGVLASDLNGDTVDLGLSVLWTTCNLGALSPEEYGAYWAWGETSVKANYEWSTYKYCKGTSSTLTKYVRFSDFGYNGFVDNKSKLDPMDDAASVNLDSNYHIPSLAEWKELLENTSHLWTSNYNGTGISGYILTSTVAGYTNNSIFFPAAGYQYPTIAITGRYMTSEKVGSGFDSNCDIVEFQNNRIDGADYNETWGHSSRELGHSIRAVRTK